jgi:hypothetical protein
LTLDDPPVGHEDFIYELPEDYGGNLKATDLHDRNNGLMAFDITTGMKDA